MGENIGAVARAMSNFGLSELRIVAPRDGWPNPKAVEMAAGGLDIINSAIIYPDFTSAMADIHTAYATTARPRDINKRVVSAQTAMQEIVEVLIPKPQSLSLKPINIALVFGPERTGIENEEIILCDNIISIATSEKNRSLNLAQSSVIIGYEWIKVSSEQNNPAPSTQPLAPKGDMFGLLDQLEKYLDQAQYFRTENKKTIMWKNLKNMLLRGKWSEQEIRTFRGMLRSLWERGKTN
mgnify:FL=1